MQSFNREDLTVRIQAEGVELRTQDVGSMTLAWVTLAKGIDLEPGLQGLPGDLCQCPHWGYLVLGRLRMKTAEGNHEYKAGDAFYWGPGHAPEALEDTVYIDFSPTEEFNVVLDHLSGGGAS